MSYTKHTWETEEVITKEKLNNMENGIADVDGKVDGILVNMGTISSLPITKTVQGVSSSTEVVSCEFGNPEAILSDITVTPGTNSITLSGTISGSSSVMLTLIHIKSVSAT